MYSWCLNYLSSRKLTESDSTLETFISGFNWKQKYQKEKEKNTTHLCLFRVSAGFFNVRVSRLFASSSAYLILYFPAICLLKRSSAQTGDSAAVNILQKQENWRFVNRDAGSYTIRQLFCSPLQTEPPQKRFLLRYFYRPQSIFFQIPSSDFFLVVVEKSTMYCVCFIIIFKRFVISCLNLIWKVLEST